MIDAKVAGLEQLEAQARQLERKVADAVGDAAKLEAREVLADERKLVPVLTGELRDGLEVWLDTDKTGAVTASVGIRNGELFWAVFIEWGRSSAAAQPFATPASELARKRWPKRARKALDAALKAKG